MCGRYNISDPSHVDLIASRLGIKPEQSPIRFNISPTEVVPVFFTNDAGYGLRDMRWWLVPSWSSGPSSRYAMFNARAETLTTSRAYQKPFRQQRAIIPASSFIEWTAGPEGKQAMLIQPENGPIAFAGLWDYWSDGTDSLYSCSIITTAATRRFSRIHKRMPVMLAEDDYEAWLDHTTPLNEVDGLLKPRSVASMSVTAVSKTINRATDKSAPAAIGDADLIY